MVATTSSYNSRAEIWQIINTGRLFLRALERFAIENFPDDGAKSSNTKGTRHVNNQRRQQRSDGGNLTGTSSTVRTKTSPAAATSTKKRPAPDSAADDGVEEDRVSSPSKRQKKGVIMYDVKTNQVKGHFDSAAAAARSLMSKNPEKSFKTIESGISAVLTGKQKSVVGYKFRHVGANSEPLPVPTITKPKQNLDFHKARYTGPVEQYCAETGQLQHRFESASKASEAFVEANPEYKLVTVSKGISRVLRGERATYFNLLFRYEKDKSPLPSFPLDSKRPSKQPGDSTQNDESTQQQEQEQKTTTEKPSTSPDTPRPLSTTLTPSKDTAEEDNGNDGTTMIDAAVAHVAADNNASGSSTTFNENTTDPIKQKEGSEKLVTTNKTRIGSDNDEPDETNSAGKIAASPDGAGPPVASASSSSSSSSAAATATATATPPPVPSPDSDIEDKTSKKQQELGEDVDDGGGGKAKSSAGFATI